MYFNLLALLVHTSLIMKLAPVFRTGSLAFVAFNLNKMGNDLEGLDEEFIELLGSWGFIVNCFS